MDKIIGQNIEKARKESGLTQDELARDVGVTPGSLGHWEKGIRACKPIYLSKIAEITGKPIGWFFGEIANFNQDGENSIKNILDTIKEDQKEMKHLIREINRKLQEPDVKND